MNYLLESLLRRLNNNLWDVMPERLRTSSQAKSDSVKIAPDLVRSPSNNFFVGMPVINTILTGADLTDRQPRCSGRRGSQDGAFKSSGVARNLNWEPRFPSSLLPFQLLSLFFPPSSFYSSPSFTALPLLPLPPFPCPPFPLHVLRSRIP